MMNAEHIGVSRSSLSLEMVLAKAAKIGTKPGCTFFEHPIHGDEAGLLLIMSDVVYQTDFHDLPDFDIAGVYIIGEP